MPNCDRCGKWCGEYDATTVLEQRQFMLKKLITYLEDTESQEQLDTWQAELDDVDKELGHSLQDFI